MSMKPTLFSGVIPGVTSRNRHEVDGDTVRLFITDHGVEKPVLIDIEDAPLILRPDVRWHLSGKYAAFRRRSTKDFFYLHHLLVKPLKGHDIDHVNQIRLDNRRCNIRVVTHAQNAQNRLHGHGLSGFKNVTWNKDESKWVVAIFVDGKKKYIGRFLSLEAAAEAAKAARIKHHPFSPENSGREVQS